MRRVGRLVLDRMRRQFLRRDRAGRVLHQQHRARRRLHQRSAAAGPQLLLSRHAAEAAGRPELHASADQRAEVPVPHFQQDGHMAFVNPKGRANYEPNSWGGAQGGPREIAGERASASFPAEEAGRSVRVARRALRRPLQPGAAVLSSARPPVEQAHIKTRLRLRAEQGRDAGDPRAHGVAPAERRRRRWRRRSPTACGSKKMPKPAEPARAGATGSASRRRRSASSRTGRTSFEGRKLGAAGHRRRRRRASRGAGEGGRGRGRAWSSWSRPKVGGVKASDGTGCARRSRRSTAARRCSTTRWRVLPSAEGARAAQPSDATARDFVADAFAHAKFIAYVEAAKPLLDKAGVVPDDGCVALGSPQDAAGFIATCRKLRFWEREATAA